MVCRAATFVGPNEQNKTWKNWSGDVSFSAEEYFEPAHTSQTGTPDGLLQLVHVVARATDEGQPLKAIGSGWSFEDIAKSDSWVVCLKQLTRRLENVVGDTGVALTEDCRTRYLGPNALERLIHVEAGIELGALIEMLEVDGMAMPVLGGHNGQSLAGAIATSTHGGDWEQPPLPDLVKAIHLVTVGGRELWIERATAPITRDDRLRQALTCADTEIVRDDRIFDSTLVSFGRFGVIYSLVLQVRKHFRVVETVTTPTRDEVVQALHDGQTENQLFRPLLAFLSSTDPPAGLTEQTTDSGFFMRDPYFLQVVFNSQDPDRCWVTRRWETLEGEDLPAGLTIKTELTGAGVFLIANAAFSAAAAAALAIPGVGVVYHAQLVKAATKMLEHRAHGRPTMGAALASALTVAWELPLVARTIPEITTNVLDHNFKESITNGRRGSHALITSGSRDESHTFDLLSDSIEVTFDAAEPQYLTFVDAILTKAPSFKQSGYVSLRPSRSSRAALSMHNVSGSHTISIEVATAKDLPDNIAWMAYVHDKAMEHGGRPHWGQYNKMSQQHVGLLYHDSVTIWREALYRVSKGSMIFSNAFTRQRGLEPLETTDDISYLVPLLLCDASI